MDFRVCMNGSCGGIGYEREWKKGWPLESGGFARLCNNCGFAYENSIFCEKFHPMETGWRECSYCSKSIHCGCIVSLSLFKHLSFGGIGCMNCVNTSQHLSSLRLDIQSPNVFLTSTKHNANDRHAAHIDSRLLVDSVDEGKLMQLCRIVEASESSHCPQRSRDDIFSYIVPNSQEVKSSFREADARFSNVMKPPNHSSTFTSLRNNRQTWENKNMQDALALSMSLGTTSQNTVLHSATEKEEQRLKGKTYSPFHQGQIYRHILPKPLKTGLTMIQETNNGMISEAQAPQLPAEYSGKHQLLPRYWPRITDEELEKLSVDLKSSVVPLFEKVLSASDAGRIGGLALPKACAEAYFPPISHSRGLPLQFQDGKGNELTLQFRFWPNNNSRMYVLEGVTPFIQSMQLRPGDTVTFSRIDPGGKFVIGFRRASDSIHTQNASESAQYNGISIKEAQDLLYPPPSVKTNIVTIEDQEIEEYHEPPLIGKRTIFNACPSGSLCSTPEEQCPREVDNLLRTSKVCKKRRRMEKSERSEEDESLV